jgi:hypothetical protein
LTAHVTLKDGRDLSLSVTVLLPRPTITLLNKIIGHSADSSIHLGGQDDLPVNQTITFSLKSALPFPRTSSVEVANSDESLHTQLSVAAGTLILQNPHTILATLDPLKTFGTSAFGPLRFRAVAPDGTTGDWLPLATLVRLPTLSNIRCTADVAAACILAGSDLYLVDSLAPDTAFTAPTTIPEGFVGDTLDVPRPTNLGPIISVSHPPSATFYLRLRDDPAVKNTVTLPVLPDPTKTAASASQPTARN